MNLFAAYNDPVHIYAALKLTNAESWLWTAQLATVRQKQRHYYLARIQLTEIMHI
jgi:hypothetical protein